jgi:hypothetical protein
MYGAGEEKMREYGVNGQNYIKNKCNYEATVRPLLEWLNGLGAVKTGAVKTGAAPDRGKSVKMNGGALWKSALRYLKENGIKKTFRKLLQSMR